MVNELTLELIGGVIVIAGILLVLIVILAPSVSFIGDVACSQTINWRSSFSNTFLKVFGVAAIDERIFNVVPLLCNFNIELKDEKDSNIEGFIADEVIKCYNKYGAGKLNGAYPYESALCSAIVFNVTDESGIRIDLMRVYDEIFNNPSFDKTEDLDDVGLDYYNSFRFVVPSQYQSNIYYDLAINEVCSSDWIEESEDYFIMNGFCEDEFIETDAKDLSLSLLTFKRLMGSPSLKEAALNDWQFEYDSSEFSQYYINSDLEDRYEYDSCSNYCVLNSKTFQDYESCFDQCYSNNFEKIACQYSCFNNFGNNLLSSKLDNSFSSNQFLLQIQTSFFSQVFLDTRDCLDACEAMVNLECSPTSCDKVIEGLNIDLSEGYNTLFKSEDFVETENFNSSTTLGRGVFYIRFFEYTNSFQEIKKDLLGQPVEYFPECNNYIISQFNTDSANNKDYVAICYVPSIPYELINPDEFDAENYLVMYP